VEQRDAVITCIISSNGCGECERSVAYMNLNFNSNLSSSSVHSSSPTGRVTAIDNMH